jgi:hypothetical protein
MQVRASDDPVKMMQPIGEADLQGLEEAVQRSLRTGDTSGVNILGYGEITLVLGWPSESPRWACKRLPVFESRERCDAYGRTFRSYLNALQERGVVVLESEFRAVKTDSDGRRRWAAYVVQPCLEKDRLMVERLRSASEEEARSLFESVVDRIAGAVGPMVGMDAQLSNWALGDGEASGKGSPSTLLYFDVSTPLLRDESGNHLLDVDVFLASLPGIARGFVRRFMVRDILDIYHDLRTVLLDVAANLYKDDLDEMVPLFCAVASRRLEKPITTEKALEYHKRDALVWSWLQRVRRLDRFWQTKIRRRTYPYLLPPRVYAGKIRR